MSIKKSAGWETDVERGANRRASSMYTVVRVFTIACAALVLLLPRLAQSQTVIVPNGVDLDAEVFQNSHGYSGCGINVFAVVALPHGYTGPPRLMEAYSFDLDLSRKGRGLIGIVKATTLILKRSPEGRVTKQKQARPLGLAFGLPNVDKPISLVTAHNPKASPSFLGVLPGLAGAQVFKTLIMGTPLLAVFQMNSSGGDDVLSVAGHLRPKEEAGVEECVGWLIDSLKNESK